MLFGNPALPNSIIISKDYNLPTNRNIWRSAEFYHATGSFSMGQKGNFRVPFLKLATDFKQGDQDTTGDTKNERNCATIHQKRLVNLWFNPILSVSALGSPLTLISSYFYSDVCSMKYFCEMDVQIEYSIRRKALCCLFKKSNDIKKSSDIITPLFFN